MRKVVAPLLLFVLCGACRRPSAPPETRIELVESAPLETTLDHAYVPNATDVWLKMIDDAKTSIDFAEFYASEADEKFASGSKLTPIIDATLRAAARGVHVRFLADAKFAKQYPATLERFAKSGIDVRRFDVEARTGGVLHAKYFVVDGASAFIGSQNFDWRSLSHIFEMGVQVDSKNIAGALLDVFETDWALAGGGGAKARVHTHPRTSDHANVGGETIAFVASPSGWLPDESEWELPRIVSALDAAKRQIAVEVLTYKTKDRSGAPFLTLDDALRRAAARGVSVRLLVSDWNTRGDARKAIDELSRVKNIDVRVITIPAWSGGDVPFARVAHAKYLVVDDDHAWVGTGNWEGDYFTKSRNVGVIVDGGALPLNLKRAFDDNWSSPYVRALSADAAPPSNSDPAPR